jgi:hypothetical protein
MFKRKREIFSVNAVFQKAQRDGVFAPSGRSAKNKPEPIHLALRELRRFIFFSFEHLSPDGFYSGDRINMQARHITRKHLTLTNYTFDVFILGGGQAR